ncbi:Synaptonemal complex protein ZEP1 [Linum perenne]
MLDSKQLELSKHLQEISTRNDQAITEIRRKYEDEKLGIINMEKEKVNKLLYDMERNCDQKLSEQKEDSRQQLMRIQNEHAALILQIQQENERKEASLKAHHNEELKQAEIQAENREREGT